ncbi:MAG: hypothetical protein ABH868_07755 [bacterium]
MKKFFALIISLMIITYAVSATGADNWGNLVLSVSVNDNLSVTLYDFEDGTTQGWLNDTSGAFLDNLGVPVNSTDQGENSVHSLAYSLNLDEKDPVYGYINDRGYVRPSSPIDLSSANGISSYVYIPDIADISSSTPAKAAVYVKTGAAWRQFDTNNMVNISLGAWNRVTINFSSAKDESGQINQQVTDIDDIREIGIHISGAENSGETTTLYVDNVGALGEEQVLLSVSISGSYDFGILGLGAEVVSDTPFTVINSGTITETFSIHLVDPFGWSAAGTNPGEETYVLNAMFNSAKPLQSSFVELNHALSNIPQRCGVSKFAGDQTGDGVPASDSRLLWLEFRAPIMTTITTPQSIRLIVTAEAS